MDKVISKDGTQIAFDCSGSGPALLIVGGALADHHFYAPLAAELERHYTVFNFDRRGRGQSGDTQPYEVEREIEDVAALIDQAKEPVFLYGHSAGVALALRAAAAGLAIRTLALADPPFTPRGDRDEQARLEFASETAFVEELRQRGDSRASARFFLGSMGMPDDAIDELLNSPAGARIVDCARALRYEYAMLGDGLVPITLARRVTLPTVILSADTTQSVAAQLASNMRDARILITETAAHETSPTAMAERLHSALTV